MSIFCARLCARVSVKVSVFQLGWLFVCKKWSENKSLQIPKSSFCARACACARACVCACVSVCLQGQFALMLLSDW